METTIGSYHKKFLVSGYNGAVGSILTQYSNVFQPFDSLLNFADVDAFVHLASSSQNSRIIESNIIYLQKTIDFCLKNDIKNFIYFSSVSVYGKQNTLNVDEKSCNNDVSFYGLSKLFAEKYLQNIQDLHILVLRLPAVLTKKNDTYIASLLQKLKSNEEIVISNPEKQFNNFIGIDDIVRFVSDYKFDKKYEVLNFASSQKQTLKDIVLYLKDITASKSKISYDEKKDNFYNLSVEKLEKNYNFIVTNYKKSLQKWIELNEK